MKKKWLVMSLIVLIMQTLTPLMVLADVIDSKSDRIQLISLDSEKSGDNELEEQVVNLKINFGVTEEWEEVLTLNGFTAKSSNKELLKNNLNEVVGWYQGTGDQLAVHIDENSSGNANLSLLSELTDKKVNQQEISVSLNQQEVTSSVSVETGEKDKEEAAESTDEDSEETSDATEETTREPVNIETLLNGEAFFKEVTLKKVINEDPREEIDVTKTTLFINDRLALDMSYILPEDVREKMKSGDYYKTQLPAELKIYSLIRGELKNEKTGSIYGEYEVSTSGELTITFNEKIEKESDISGNFKIDSTLQQGNMTEVGKNTIDFPYVENNPKFDVFVRPTVENSISKTGEPNKPNNPSSIKWDVDINKNYSQHTNAKVTEKFPKGTKFKSVEIHELSIGFNGEILGVGNVLSTADYTITTDGTEITFNKPINKAYRITYETSIDNASKPGDKGGEVTYSNEASLTSKEQTTPLKATDEVSVVYKTMLHKEMTDYNPDNQTFNWQIKYNHNESTIGMSKAIIKDVFKGDMSLNESSLSLKKITFDDNGNPNSEGTLLEEGKDYNLLLNSSKNGFDIQFLSTVDYAVTIDYQTKINDEIHESNGGDNSYSNSVTDGNNNVSKAKGQAYQRGLAKWYSNLDYHDKTVDWHVRINSNEYEMNNFVLTDKMSPGLTLSNISDDFIIRDYTGGKRLKEKEDYTLTYSEETGEFSVMFIGGYQKTNHEFEVTYVTSFDTPKLHEAGLEEFLNEVEATWEGSDGRVHTNSSRYGFTPKLEESADGFKHGNYNAKTKEIDWKLGVNYNKQVLGDVTISDKLQSNQVYVPNSMKVYRYKINADGEVILGERIVGEELSQLFEIAEPNKKENAFAPKDPLVVENELKIKVKNVTEKDQYLFMFKTTLNDQIVHESSKYHNTAYVDASNVGERFKIEGDVSINSGDSLIEKGGYQDSEGFVQWSVKINPSQSTIYQPVVTDRPSSNQSINQESVVLYELDTDERGNLKKGKQVDKSDYTILVKTNEETFEQKLELTFKEEKIDRAYLLEYKTSLFLEKPSGERASNSISIEGMNQEKITQMKSESVFVRMSTGSGTATGKQGRVTVNKTSETGEALSETVFELWDKEGKQIISEEVTTEQGEAVFNNIPLGNYLLKETKAKEGYVISEELTKGMPIKVSRLTSTGVEKINLINQKISLKTSINVAKNWEDGDNQDGKRPSSVSIQLYKNDKEEGEAIELSNSNSWKYQWKDLDAEENGSSIKYRVEEKKVPDYTTSINDKDQGNIIITNTHTPEKRNLSGEKTWDDNDNQDGFRPESIVVNVLKNNQEFLAKKVTPDKNGKWTYNFEGLDAYEHGQPITYSVNENNVEGYTPEVNETNIKNMHTPGKTNVLVNKAWEDHQNQDGKRPESVLVQLYKNGIVEGKPEELSERNKWQHNWTDLAEKDQGKTVKYTVKEVTKVPGYETSINDKDQGNIIITNTHTPEKTNLSGEKTWDDHDNQDGFRPESIVVNVLKNNQAFLSKKVTPDKNGKWLYNFDGLDAYENGQPINYSVNENNVEGYRPEVNETNIKNTHTPGKTNVLVSKAWEDHQNQDGKRPTLVSVQLYKNDQAEGKAVDLTEANGWKYQWTDLAEKEQGQPIKYTVKEVTKVPGYTTSINDKDQGNIIITNTHTPEKRNLSGEKTWDDNDNQDGFRPESIVVNVLKNNQAFLSKKVTPDKNGKWLYNFDGLDAYENGQPINYSVNENNIEGYRPEVTGTNIKNTHTPGKTNVLVSKAWEDHHNQDGKRPESVLVQLYKNGTVEGKPEELSERNKWQHNWTDLAEKDQGKTVTYTVKEVTKVPGYTTTINNKDQGNIIITNTHIPETTNLSGEKTWDDHDNQANKRPEKITVNLLKNGQKISSKEVKEDSKWTYDFGELPKYEAGEIIKYSVTEDSVLDYTATVSGYNIKNRYTPGKTNVTVTKAWNDSNNKYKKRPKDITVQLYANNKKEGNPVKLSDVTDWTKTWQNLDSEKAGEIVSYHVEEVTKMKDYKGVVNEENSGNIIITNNYIGEKIDSRNGKSSNGNNNSNGNKNSGLPKTGEKSTSGIAILGLGLVAVTVYYYKRRRKYN